MQMEKCVARERLHTNGRQKNQSEHQTFRSPYARIPYDRCCVAVARWSIRQVSNFSVICSVR